MKWIEIKLTIMTVCAISLSNCTKQDTEHLIPVVNVNINISTNLAQYNQLNIDGGWVYLEGGYNGIIVYRSSIDNYKAYDRQAPYKVKDVCKINIDDSQVIVTDSCSGSSWLLYDGQVVTGPATYPLKEYETYYDGSILSITN